MKNQKSSKQIDLSAIARAVLQKRLHRRLRGYRTLPPVETAWRKQK